MTPEQAEGAVIERRKIAKAIGMRIPEGTLHHWQVIQYIADLRGKLDTIAKVLRERGLWDHV